MNTNHADDWWRHAVVYQIYVRSFADSNGDGVGDIAGITQRLQYVADLGVDAIWINPWYPSPMADAGYDVADYRGIEPVFGTMEDADALIAEAHRLGLKVLLDIVPNHSSDQHALFQQALASPEGSAERAKYIFRDGKGANGELPPNDWQSIFGGPAWTRSANADGTPGQWFCHLFTPQQPDFDWNNRAVHEEFQSTLRFWFDKGVDGFRIDVAHGLTKAEGLPDVGTVKYPALNQPDDFHPHWDRQSVHDIYREWRQIADSYEPPRIFVAEAWASDPSHLARYVRSDELNTAFNFDFLLAPWKADELRTTIDSTLSSHAEVGAPPTWVLSNHDVVREVSRYARPQSKPDMTTLEAFEGLPVDWELGQKRARAAALLMLALPGGAYIYQGGELGLAEVEDIDDNLRQDPIWNQTNHEKRGRDGCRVPMPWSGSASPFGFSPGGASAKPWLPMPDWFKTDTVEAEVDDRESMLSLYRDALISRRSNKALGDGPFAWTHQYPTSVLAFKRGDDFTCVVNLSDGAIELDPDLRVLLASSPIEDNMLLPDAAVWLIS